MTFKLHARNIKTADAYHIDGAYGFCAHDLLQFGSTGATIAAANGRYVWVFSPDHPSSNSGWADGQNFFIGYSSDPGIPPETVNTVVRDNYRSSDTGNASNQFLYYHFNDLVYNPDDATYPFYLYGEGFVSSGPDSGVRSNHECGLLRSSDLVTWVGYGGTHKSVAFAGFTSFQRVKRNGSGDWVSYGFNDTGAGGVVFGMGKWTSTDALTWSTNTAVQLTRTVSSCKFTDPVGQPLTVNISGQDYIIMAEDARGADGGMYVTAAPVDSSLSVLASPSKIRLSEKYDGVFPTLGYLQQVGTYQEDGIQHIWASHGYFSDEANSADGMHDQAYDYGTLIFDATAAADAAPVGVRVQCLYGAVIVSWYDALPNQTYRVYKSTDGGSTYPSHVDVTGLKYVDAAGDIGAVYFYNVVTLHSGVEKGNRIVSTYVSNGRELTNKHVTRVLAAGGTNISVPWVDAVVGWLTDHALIDECQFWADPAFGVIKSGSNISKVFCLGSTIHPRGGDYTTETPANTTYSGTGMNGNVPAWVNGATSAHGYFGGNRFNNIRRKAEITFGGVWSRANTNLASLLTTSEFGGLTFQHQSGSPGSVTFRLKFTETTTGSQTAASATGPNIAFGVFDGVAARCYVSGVAGSDATGVSNTFALDGQRSQTQDTNIDFLGSGTEDIKYQVGAGTRNFGQNQSNFTCSTLLVFDRALTAWQAKELYTFLNARIGGASYSLPAYDTPFVKDIKADYSAVGDGSTDDSAAFASFKTAVATWQGSHTGLVILKIPGGSYYFQGGTGKSFTGGIKKLILLGEQRSASILTDNNGAGGGFFLGNGQTGCTFNDNAHSSRISTVAAGATSVTPVSTSLWTTSDWALVTGIDLQGGGFPINPYYFEFRKITSIGGGAITFDTPLENAYKSTWPVYNAGDGSNADQGGPGTLYAIDQGWDLEHNYVDLGIDQSTLQTNAKGRFITFTRCSASGPGVFPSENFVWRANDHLQTDSETEVDKIVKKVIYDGGLVKQLTCQSASAEELVLRGAAHVNVSLNGTPKNFYADGFYVADQAHFGPNSYGVAEKAVVLNGSIVGGLAFGGANESGLVAAGYSMASGIIQASKAGHGPVPWAIPGKRGFWKGSLITENSFVVSDISESGGNTLIMTDQAAGFPSLAGNLGIQAHPAPIFTMRGVTGGPNGGLPGTNIPSNIFAEQDLSLAAPGTPLYSRSSRTYAYLNIGNSDSTRIEGKLVSITINVTTPYTGANSTLLWNFLGQFGGDIIKTDGTHTTWNPQIDLKTSGVRTILASGATGAVGSDANLAAPANPLWLSGALVPFINHDISAETGVGPTVTLSFQTDQSSFDVTAALLVMPLRFRLHAA